MATPGLKKLFTKLSTALAARSAKPKPGTEGTGGINLSYAPVGNGRPDPGEVVWTWIPYEDDPSQGKDRPVLILGRKGRSLAVVQLSTKDHSGRRDAAEWVAVGTGGWDRERRQSYVDASRLLMVKPAKVRREGAAMDRQHFAVVLERVAQFHGWTLDRS